MADIKISQLGSAITVEDSDIVPVVSDGNTLKATAAQLKEHAIGNTSISGIGDGSVTGAISALNSDKQPKTLATPITVDGTPQTTVEGALGAINTDLGSTKQALSTQENLLGAKNLLYIDKAVYTYRGITYTVQEDGTILASGTCTASEGDTSQILIAQLVNLNDFVGKEFILTGEGLVSGTYIFWVMHFLDSTPTETDALAPGAEKRFTIRPNVKDISLSLRVDSGVVLSPPIVVKPMIRPEAIKDNTYVPYAMTNREFMKIKDSIAFTQDKDTNHTGAIITAGTQFYHNGILCIATADVAALGNLVYGTNYTYADTVAKQLSSLGNSLSGMLSRFRVLTSGSLHDITESGIYYLTGAVSDKPVSTGGIYIIAAYSANLSAGIYISYDGANAYTVGHSDNTWYANKLVIQFNP